MQATQQAHTAMSGETILIVDDEPMIVEVVGLYLQREGYRVVTAADGATALSLVEQQRPDLVVLDLMLPGLSGHGGTLCSRLTFPLGYRTIGGYDVGPI